MRKKSLFQILGEFLSTEKQPSCGESWCVCVRGCVCEDDDCQWKMWCDLSVCLCWYAESCCIKLSQGCLDSDGEDSIAMRHILSISPLLLSIFHCCSLVDTSVCPLIHCSTAVHSFLLSCPSFHLSFFHFWSLSFILSLLLASFLFCLLVAAQWLPHCKKVLGSNPPFGQGLSVWSLHVFSVSAWVLSEYFSFLLQSKNMQLAGLA